MHLNPLFCFPDVDNSEIIIFSDGFHCKAKPSVRVGRKATGLKKTAEPSVELKFILAVFLSNIRNIYFQVVT